MIPAERSLVDLGEGETTTLIGVGDVGLAVSTLSMSTKDGRAHIVVGEVVEGGVAAGGVDGSRHGGRSAIDSLRAKKGEEVDGGQREPAVLSGQQGSNSHELSSELQDGQQRRGWQRGPKRGRGTQIVLRQASPCTAARSRGSAVGVGCDVERVCIG